MSRAVRALLGSILAVLAVWSMASSPAAALSLPVPSVYAYDAASCCVDAASSHGNRRPPPDAAQLQPRRTAETDADAVPTRPDDLAHPQTYAYDLTPTLVRLTSVETDTTSGSTRDLGGSTGSAIALAPLQVAAKTADDWLVISGMVRDAAKSKGNFGLGSGTASQATRAGESWVGDGYRVASDGKTLISRDGLRAFRPPSWKPNLGKYQANFEHWVEGQVRREPMGNGHFDVTDIP